MFITWVLPTFAAHPLVQASEVADVGLQAWWRQGELMVGRPSDPSRPALRPLVSPSPTRLPTDLSGWTPVGQVCEDPPTAVGEFGEVAFAVHLLPDGPAVVVQFGEIIAAKGLLNKPVTVCALDVLEADAVPGPEVVVSWTMGDVQGFTIFHVPESARP